MKNKQSVTYGYSNFGNLSKQYAEARQGFPEEVMAWFWTFVKNRDTPRILDLGCGTGISTRQIAKGSGVVIGCDIDGQMIAEAKKAYDGLEYVVATAEKLPFSDAEFDAVTAFSAFHWFANGRALSEIKRVLKPRGIFYIVNKNDAGDFKEGYRSIFKKFCGYILPEKNTSDFEELLIKAGFTDVMEKNFEASDFYTLSGALVYRQSASTWNLIPEKARTDVLLELRDYYKKRMVRGLVERKLSVKCFVGRMG